MAKNGFFNIKRNVFVLGLVSLLNDVSNEMIRPLLPIFLTVTLGAPVAMVGLIEGMAKSIASFLEIGSGMLSDRLRKRKSLIVSGYGIAVAARSFLALATTALQVFMIVVIDRAGKGLRNAPRDAMIADSSKSHRGRAFGFHRAMDNLGGTIGPALALLLIPFMAMRDMFIVALIPGALGVIIVALFAKERFVKPRDEIVPSHVIGEKLRVFLLIPAIFGLANFSHAFLILKILELGYGAFESTLMYIIFAATAALLSFYIGSLSDRISRRWLGVAGFSIFAAVSIMFSYADSIALMPFLFVLYGLAFSITDTVPRAYVSDLAETGKRGTALGSYHAIVGLTALPASFVFGSVWQIFGSATAFGLAAALAFSAAFFLAMTK